MSNNQSTKIHDEDIGCNEAESRPDREMRDVVIGRVDYQKGRGYYLNVFVQGESTYPGGAKIVTRIIPLFRENPLDISMRLAEAKRFHKGTLAKIADDSQTRERLANLVAAVKANYAAKKVADAAKKAAREAAAVQS